MKWSELLKLEMSNWGIVIGIGPVLLISLALLVIVAFILLRKKHGYKFWHKYEVVEGEVPIATLGKVIIRPNHDTIRIAYQAWVELTTRKAAVPFDEKCDVIDEVYNSWYEVFDRMRELAKAIPAHKLRQDKDTQKLVMVMVEVLNNGLRPHLTEWQAKFRRWYEEQINDNANDGLSPQEIQRKYPDYKQLVENLKQVNGLIINYANWLRKISQGN